MKLVIGYFALANWNWMRDSIPAKTRRKRRPKVKELPDLPVADEALSESVESPADWTPSEED